MPRMPVPRSDGFRQELPEDEQTDEACYVSVESFVARCARRDQSSWLIGTT